MAIKKIPMRMCVACREMKPKAELVRIVRTPEGDMVPDFTGKRNGRGAYICRCAQCIEKARKSNALGRAFSQQIGLETYDRLLQELGLLEK